MQLGLLIAVALLVVGVVAWPLVTAAVGRRGATDGDGNSDGDGDTAGNGGGDGGANADADGGANADADGGANANADGGGGDGAAMDGTGGGYDDGDAGRLAAELNDVYDTIRTLQTEHSLGRIGEADFRAQLDEYRRRAARILRALEGGAGGAGAGGDGEGERGG